MKKRKAAKVRKAKPQPGHFETYAVPSGESVDFRMRFVGANGEIRVSARETQDVSSFRRSLLPFFLSTSEIVPPRTKYFP